MIHTFWHNTDINKKLPFNNVNCIKSWIHQGKEINIWVYDNNILPSDFRTFCNNHELISINDADQIIPYDEYTTIDYGSNGHSFASFSDVFRYKVLDIFGGWWLDTDIILLNRNLDTLESDLDNDSEPLFFIERYSTHQDRLKLNNAVIYAPKKGIMDSFYKESLSILNDMIENKRIGSVWGNTGPDLITDRKNDVNHGDYRDFYLIDFYTYTGSLYNYAYSQLTMDNLVKFFKQKPFGIHLWESYLYKHGSIKRFSLFDLCFRLSHKGKEITIENIIDELPPHMVGVFPNVTRPNHLDG